MHLVFGATGIQHELELFAKYMQTRDLLLPYKDKEGKDGNLLMQSQLRPIQFYDFVFPRGELHRVLNGLKPENQMKSDNCKLPTSYISILRKALKLKKIPKPDVSKGAIPIYKNNVRIVGIGIRDDKDMSFPNGLTHEGI